MTSPTRTLMTSKKRKMSKMVEIVGDVRRHCRLWSFDCRQASCKNWRHIY